MLDSTHHTMIIIFYISLITRRFYQTLSSLYIFIQSLLLNNRETCLSLYWVRRQEQLYNSLCKKNRCHFLFHIIFGEQVFYDIISIKKAQWVERYSLFFFKLNKQLRVFFRILLYTKRQRQKSSVPYITCQLIFFS